MWINNIKWEERYALRLLYGTHIDEKVNLNAHASRSFVAGEPASSMGQKRKCSGNKSPIWKHPKIAFKHFECDSLPTENIRDKVHFPICSDQWSKRCLREIPRCQRTYSYQVWHLQTSQRWNARKARENLEGLHNTTCICTRLRISCQCPGHIYCSILGLLGFTQPTIPWNSMPEIN